MTHDFTVGMTRIFDTAGTSFQSQGVVSKQQLALLDDAREACQSAKATLSWSGQKSDVCAASLASQLDVLMANFDNLHQLVDMQVRPQGSHSLSMCCRTLVLSRCFLNR